MEKRQFVLSLKDIDHKSVKMHSAKHGVTMNMFIVAAIHYYIDGLEKKPKPVAEKDSPLA